MASIRGVHYSIEFHLKLFSLDWTNHHGTAIKKNRPCNSVHSSSLPPLQCGGLIDAAKGYETHLDQGGKMMVCLAGAMSTAELGLSLAEMIRQDKIHLISCTGANLEEDVFNLVAHDFYERVPHYRQLSPQDEQDLLERHMNRVTDTCIPEGEAMRRMETAMLEVWTAADGAGKRFFRMSFSIRFC